MRLKGKKNSLLVRFIKTQEKSHYYVFWMYLSTHLKNVYIYYILLHLYMPFILKKQSFIWRLRYFEWKMFIYKWEHIRKTVPSSPHLSPGLFLIPLCDSYLLLYGPTFHLAVISNCQEMVWTISVCDLIPVSAFTLATYYLFSREERWVDMQTGQHCPVNSACYCQSVLMSPGNIIALLLPKLLGCKQKTAVF